MTSDAVTCRIAALNIHPIKSCAGITLDEALLVETGLELDRAWMVVDERGGMLTQRQWPRMALVSARLRSDELVLRAPGMLALHLRLDAVEVATRARVWSDDVRAFDMGDLAAQWFSDFLGARLRLVRFDPDQRRLASRVTSGSKRASRRPGRPRKSLSHWAATWPMSQAASSSPHTCTRVGDST